MNIGIREWTEINVCHGVWGGRGNVVSLRIHRWNRGVVFNHKYFYFVTFRERSDRGVND